MKGKLEGEKEVFPLISGFGYQMSWFLFLHQLTILPKKKKKKKNVSTVSVILGLANKWLILAETFNFVSRHTEKDDSSSRKLVLENYGKT